MDTGDDIVTVQGYVKQLGQEFNRHRHPGRVAIIAVDTIALVGLCILSMVLYNVSGINNLVGVLITMLVLGVTPVLSNLFIREHTIAQSKEILDEKPDEPMRTPIRIVSANHTRVLPPEDENSPVQINGAILAFPTDTLHKFNIMLIVAFISMCFIFIIGASNGAGNTSLICTFCGLMLASLTAIGASIFYIKYIQVMKSRRLVGYQIR